MRVTTSTLAAILRTQSPHIRVEDNQVSFALICTVEEGPGCRFAPAALSEGTLDALAEGIVDELGWKAIEHAARRQVVLRCRIPGGNLAQAVCECDRGDGPQILAVDATGT